MLVCSALARGGADTVLRALEYGAVDVVQKPRAGIQDFLYESAVLLVDKVRGAARARARGTRQSAPPMPPTPRHTADVVLPPLSRPLSVTTDKVVAVGASTGGTEALRVAADRPAARRAGVRRGPAHARDVHRARSPSA